ncbi:unnamed protein product [Gadus morhua 'NCC']
MDRLRSERNTTGGTSMGRDTLSTAVIKNVFTVALCISINYINGTLVHTFTRHQIFYMNPRYILFIHLVINDMILLTLFVFILVLTYIMLDMSVPFCTLLLIMALLTDLNTPLTLAVLAMECYIAICFPLHHVQICTVPKTYLVIGLIWLISGLTVLPDLFVMLGTESHEFLHSRVFCVSTTVFRNVYFKEKRDASNSIFLVLVWLVLFYTYFNILFAAKAASLDAKKGRNTVILHGFQLVLCMLTYVSHLVVIGLTNLLPAAVLAIRFTLFRVDPRYILFIHLVLNDIIQLSLSGLLIAIWYRVRDLRTLNESLVGRNSSALLFTETFTTVVAKNVILVALCISINYINGTLVHTFTKHQVPCSQ